MKKRLPGYPKRMKAKGIEDMLLTHRRVSLFVFTPQIAQLVDTSIDAQKVNFKKFPTLKLNIQFSLEIE